MAMLRRLRDGRPFPVPAQCLIGRSASCSLRIDERYASAEHAKLAWSSTRWVLRDLGSKNGTYVDGRRLDPGTGQNLEVGAKIGFGEPDDGWALEDAARPGALAIDLATGTIYAAQGDLLLLPDEQSPELTIYPTSEGSQWTVERADGTTAEVPDLGVVTAGGRSFRIELPVMSEATPMLGASLSLESVWIRMIVSADEEKVELRLHHHGKEIRLEPREHNYLLLTLARLRKKDAALPASERGWRTVEEIAKMLRIDANGINVATHRARRELAAAGLEGSARIVESTSGRRRFGTDRFEIVVEGT